MKRALLLLSLIFGLSVCDGPQVVYSEVPLKYFLDKWWTFEENQYIGYGYCIYLDTNGNNVWIHHPGDPGGVGVVEGSWTLKDDHFLLKGIYGVDASVWVYGTCDDFGVTVTSLHISEESKLQKCDS